MPKKVAVVGSGIGGISAAWHLARAGHQVDLYEKNDQLGGHAYSIQIEGRKVDLGFMMFGDSNPNIGRWFREELGLEPASRIPMSMSVSSDHAHDIEFSSRRPFTRLSDLFSVPLWRMLIDIYRFTVHLMWDPPVTEKSTQEWRAEGTYSKWFYDYYFLPFVAILWTIPRQAVHELPAKQFLKCLRTHAQSLYVPAWEVLLGALGRRTGGPTMLWHFMGSRYREPFQKDFEEHDGTVILDSPVVSVSRGGKQVVTQDGTQRNYDHVVLATHPEHSASMIESWDPEGAASLRRYAFHQSRIYVHRDPSFLPDERSRWASWNVRIAEEREYIMTYWMNRIQKLDRDMQDVFVTITPLDFKGRTPAENLIIQVVDWDHPKLLADCAPQATILDQPGIALSGAWLGRGFHEDGFVAGRRAALAVDDAVAARVPLYEDPGNLEVEWRPLRKAPLILYVLGLAVVASVSGFVWLLLQIF